ncbi:hypothetical protein L6452_34866 [Arctium lappa]|uniref:Uncharacterized protein n=1 Tax=Arctium lappa TaxID=4217 RepID=A0ACB8YNL7_ARCLA|nr:hypothetical protein L6452_34866 [Arctium lappa]
MGRSFDGEEGAVGGFCFDGEELHSSSYMRTEEGEEADEESLKAWAATCKSEIMEVQGIEDIRKHGGMEVEIGKLVTAMGGVLQTRASSDVSFVIVKNVLAAKYKWALNTLKKPIVSESWLHQCWKEHRVVPHESYRVLPFSGLTISVTQVPLDARKEIEKLVLQNGGKYSAELTRKSTHLCAILPITESRVLYELEPLSFSQGDYMIGDKYKVAKRWGHIHIVTRAWFDQSVARRACLNEESYPVQRSPATSMNSQRTSLTVQRSQDKVTRNSQCGPLSMTHQEISCDGMADADLEATLSQNMASTFSDIPVFINNDNRASSIQPKSSMNIDGCFAEDSQSEDNDLYMLNCKIHLVGFDASEMRRLVNMVRRGGGSRYIEKKEVRSLSAMGVINVVRTIWLEDCEREKKEIPVLRRHVAYDLLLPKDSTSFSKGSVSAMPGVKQGNPSTMQPTLPSYQSQSFSKGQQKVQHGIRNESQDNISSVFRGRAFRFSSSFPDVQLLLFESFNRGESVLKICSGAQTVGLKAAISIIVSNTNLKNSWVGTTLARQAEEGNRHALEAHPYALFDAYVPLRGHLKKFDYGKVDDYEMKVVEHEGQTDVFHHKARCNSGLMKRMTLPTLVEKKIPAFMEVSVKHKQNLR